jgi:hypothetical protein
MRPRGVWQKGPKGRIGPKGNPEAALPPPPHRQGRIGPKGALGLSGTLLSKFIWLLLLKYFRGSGVGRRPGLAPLYRTILR